MEQRIYLDNAATSFPKPPCVAEAMVHYLNGIGVNVRRGNYSAAYQAEEIVLDTRERLARLFHFDEPRNVIFTSGVTASLNILLKGFLHPGDHLLASSLEHNAVMRPLMQLAENGIESDLIPCDKDGNLLLETLPRLLRTNTRAIVCTHASNVAGTIQPLAELGAFARTHALAFIVDSAQTAGVFPLDMAAMHIDALAFTGHKGLMGPPGIGGFLIRRELAPLLTPLLSGGTGSFSHQLSVPETMPDRFEPGTPNLPGIFGLNAALQWLESIGSEQIRCHEQKLVAQFLTQAATLPGVRILAPAAKARAAVAALDFPGQDNAQIAFQLEQRYGILTRTGLHCAPMAHRALQSFPGGAIRFSPGWFNTEEQIRQTIAALEVIAAHK